MAMKIYGKRLGGLIIGEYHGEGAAPEFTQHLWYVDDDTLADIQTYYPSLTWDTEFNAGGTNIQHFALPQLDQYPIEGNDTIYDEEACILDYKNYQDTQRSTGDQIAANQNTFKYGGGGWVLGSDAYGTWPGDPSSVLPYYPDYNSSDVTTPCPFTDYLGNSLGNGTIQVQLLYHWPSSGSPATGSRVEGVYSSGAELDGDGVGIVSMWNYVFIFTPEWFDDGTPEEVPPADADGFGNLADDSRRIRVWAYELDGHKYYVIRLGLNETLVYDLTTNQWSKNTSPGLNYWKPHLGMNWKGMTATLASYPSDVVAADDVTAHLYIVDPTYSKDDDPYNIADPIAFSRQAIGGVSMRLRETTQCGAVYILGSVGEPITTGDGVTLEISDDNGHTWTNMGTVTTTLTGYEQELGWIGLGTIKAPGRLFRVTDSGALKRLSEMDMRP